MMIRVISKYFGRIALLALVLRVFESDVSSAGGATRAGDVTSAGGVTGEGGLTRAGDVTSEEDINTEGAVTNKDEVTGKGDMVSEPGLIGEVQWFEEYVEITCFATNETIHAALEDIAFTRFNDTMQSTGLMVNDCPPPRSSYADWLATLNFRVTNLKELHLQLISKPDAMHFIGLPVIHLELFVSHKHNQCRLDPIIFTPLKNLTRLNVRNVELLPLPASSQLQWMSISDGRSAGAFGGCSKLLGLNVETWEVPDAPAASAGWLAHCPQIKSIRLTLMAIHMQRRVLLGTPVPIILDIQHSLPYLVTKYLDINLAGVKRLVLANNKLPAITIRDVPESLLELDLSNNDLNGDLISDWWKELQQRPALEYLSLAHNPLNSAGLLCEQLAATDPPAGLRQFSLSGTGATRLCFGAWNSLTTLGLSNNNITKLEILHLPSAPSRPLTVDLTGNPIHSAPLDEAEYHILVKKFNETENVIVLVDVTLECDCKHAWFVRALRSLPNLLVKDHLRNPVTCSNGKPLVDTPIEQLECERFSCEGCVCRRAWSDNATVAHCGDGVRNVPRVPGLHALYAAGSRINTLHYDDLPETLLMLDLSDNQILRLNESVVNKLFSVKKRRVWLAGNPLVCECDNRALLTALQHYRTQVVDYSSIVCADNKQALHTVVVAELCVVASGRLVVTATLVASGVLVALAALAAAVYCRYERPLRIFLYARGLCLCCVEEDDTDDDRSYDAFVSFAHADEHLVIEQLLPGLERAPYSYKLCVHLRDWQPGEMIPTQIRLSVEQSRRTIIMLSRNFLQSMWAMLEFRTAHESAITEGRVRVVVVVLDDVVNDEGLDAELRGYLRTHTYLRWGDPWFWNKLRYALPHRRTASTDDAQHPAPQPADVTGDVNLSLYELQAIGEPGDVNSSLNELQPVSGPSDINSNELQALGAPGDVNLSLHELQPVALHAALYPDVVTVLESKL